MIDLPMSEDLQLPLIYLGYKSLKLKTPFISVIPFTTTNLING